MNDPFTEQLPLSFGDDELVGEHWQTVLRALRDAIEKSIGLKEAAYALDINPSSLCDALADRERKPFHAHWLVALLVRLPQSARHGVMEALSDAAGFVVVEARPMTDAQKLADLEQAVLSEFGAAGERVIQSRRRKRR